MYKPTLTYQTVNFFFLHTFPFENFLRRNLFEYVLNKAICLMKQIVCFSNNID